MKQPIRIINYREVASNFNETDHFALDVLVGLSETFKKLPSKYLYDDDGSRLFNEITELPEYYLTNCEIETLERNRERIAKYVVDAPFNLVEFGPGSSRKPAILIEHFLERNLEFQYVPIDISHVAIDDTVKELTSVYPELSVRALVSDYFAGIRWLNHRYDRKNLVLFMGSSIGNFTHAEARFFLRNLWNVLKNGDFVLIGFDLKKDIEMFLDAYNDPKGVTAQFNLNILRRINRELDGEFDPAKFRHFGTYDVFTGAMESYLVSLEQQEIFVEGIGRSFSFRPWEPIHTEYSYKYLESDIDMIARETGFVVKEHMYDSRKYFIDSVWEVRKSDSNGTTES